MVGGGNVLISIMDFGVLLYGSILHSYWKKMDVYFIIIIIEIRSNFGLFFCIKTNEKKYLVKSRKRFYQT